MTWKEVPEQFQKTIIDSIPVEWRDPSLRDKMLASGYVNTKEYLDTVLPENEQRITSLESVALAKSISKGELSALEVIKAFCHRAALTHQITNCLVSCWFDKAEKRAKELDEYFAKTGKTVGPFHGVPISYKDQVDLPGLDSSIGYVSGFNKPKSEAALLAKIFEDAGAVSFVKTTVPMAMMAPETVSNLHGYTCNSLNFNLTSGGSSGGEGSLIAAGGSPIGVGTDIGGSIRIPAAFHGLFGLRPSHGRVPYRNVTNSYSGQETMPSVIGPLSPSLEGIELFMKTVLAAEPWRQDSKVVPIPWRDASEYKQRKLTIGVMPTDGSVTPNPPIQRAIKETIAALEKAGHEVIEWRFEDQAKFSEVATKIFSADLGKEILDACAESGEPIVPVVEHLVDSTAFPEIVKVNEWWDICNEKYALQNKFLEAWANTSSKSNSGREIDALITPLWATPPFEKNKFKSVTLAYSAPFNVLDSAVVVVPVTKVDKTVDLPDPDYKPMNEQDKIVYESYNPEVYDNIPICVQVACKRLEEEKAIAIAGVLAELLKQ